jgi:hypothetical protein
MFETEAQAKAEILIAGAAVDAVRKRIDALPSSQALQSTKDPHLLLFDLYWAQRVAEAADAALKGAFEAFNSIQPCRMPGLWRDAHEHLDRADQQLLRARLSVAVATAATVAVVTGNGVVAEVSGCPGNIGLARAMLDFAIAAARTVAGYDTPGIRRAPRGWIRQCERQLRALNRATVRRAA